MASHARHPPLTRPSPQASRLTESAPLSAYPDSRSPYPKLYNPPIPHLHPVLPQGHNLAISSTATHPTFIDDGEGMSPLSVLQIHTTSCPNEGEKGLEVTLEESRMCVDDAAVDNMTQSQSQPKLTPPGGLLGVMNSNGTEIIQRPASAPPVFPHSALESGQHDAGEAFVYDMDDLRDDQVGCVHVILPKTSLSSLFAWRRLFFLLPTTDASTITLCPEPCSSISIAGLYWPSQMSHSCGTDMASDVAGRAYGSLALLFSRIDPFHPFSCCLPTISTLHDSASQLAPATRNHEQDQARILADLAKMHNFTPRPELRPFPDSHPYLYYLFPPPPTAARIIQAIVHPTLISVIPNSRSTIPEITGTRGRRTAASDRGGNVRVGEVKGPMFENVPLIDIRTGVVHYPGAGHTSVMTGGVRIGSCAEEEMEVMDMLEMMEIVEREEEMGRVEREDGWRPDTPIPEQSMPHRPSTPIVPLHPHFFDHQHVQNGYAYAGPPSSPVYTRRPTLAQFEYQQAPQQPAGMVQPLQASIRLTSPIQHRRPSSHLANEYLPQQQQQQQQSTYTTEEPTPKARRVYGYHPGFASSFSPAICAVSTPPPQSPAPYMAPALAPPGYVPANPYTPQPSPGPYAWYGVSTIGNAYTPAPDANANTIGHGYFRPSSVAACAPPIPVAATPPVELSRPTMASDSNNAKAPYTTQELEAHFLKDPELTTPPMPIVYSAPARQKRGIKHAVGKQATIGLDGFISHNGGFRSSEEPQLHPCPAAGIERPASVPPILEDEDDMMTVEAEVETGSRANRKRKRDQLAWDYRDETSGGGEGGEGASEDEVVLSADERKRARLGHGATGPRRRSFGDDERRPGSVVRANFSSCIMIYAHVASVDANTSCVLNWS